MSADPGYGETPLEPEEADALTKVGASVAELVVERKLLVRIARCAEVAPGHSQGAQVGTFGGVRDRRGRLTH